MQRTQAPHEPLYVDPTVPLIRQIENALGLGEIGPVELQRIERPIAVVGAEQDELRLGELDAVIVRIHDLDQPLAEIRADAAGQIDLRVVLYLFGEFAEGSA